MTALGNGLVLLFNGLVSLFGFLSNGITIAVIFVFLSLAWLAFMEIEELNRQGSKPEIGRH